MKGLSLILALVAGLGSGISFCQPSDSSKAGTQSPLDSYIDGLRTHQLNSAATEFTKICGAKLDGASHRFAFANDDAGTWKIVQNFPKAYDKIEMDLVDTAEIWRSSNRTLIELWDAALDVGGFERTLYCFNSVGRLTAIDSTNYQFPEEGKPWGMHERWVLGTSGEFRAAIPFEFIGLDGKAISQPHLDEDSRKFASSWGKKPPTAMAIRELKLPAALFE